jgi:FkbM family methyltransferase
MYFSDLSPYFLPAKVVTLYIDGRPITFDTQYPHDRQYISKLMLDIRIPQADIDSILFKSFVRKGDRVIDAGANIGFTAIECISAGASFVLAIEPVPEIFTRLSETCRDWKITPLQIAISDVAGVMDMRISQLHNQGSTIKEQMLSIFPQVFGGELQVSQVKTTTLDDIVERYGMFDIWKLDIEGAEVDALKGASEVLVKSPPRVVIAEIYDMFLQDFISVITPTHPYAFRAFLRKDDYGLELTAVDKFEEQNYEKTSPMYVFFQEDISCKREI